MKITKAIIVDDEEDARDVLQTLIEFSSFPIEIIAKCKNLKEAVKEIKTGKPDIVFLDIQMPEYAGYEIINFFDEIDFEIVFVTAFDQYALKAFELGAIDYLVKPINRSRLNECLNKTLGKIENKDSITEYKNLLETLQSKKLERIVIPELNNNRILNLKNIICIQGYGSYSIVYLVEEEKLTISKNLKYFERVLPEDSDFFRSQRSWIINLSHVKKYNLNKGNILLDNGVIAKISPSKLEEFRLSLDAN
jgi:two-component system LytT family response regulator